MWAVELWYDDDWNEVEVVSSWDLASQLVDEYESEGKAARWRLIR